MPVACVCQLHVYASCLCMQVACVCQLRVYASCLCMRVACVPTTVILSDDNFEYLIAKGVQILAESLCTVQ